MKKGDERKIRILETAEKLFYQKGYENTSIQDILDEMQMSKGGFYHHFESKLQLLEEMCRVQMRENGERMRAAVEAAEGDAAAQLNALYRHSVLWQEEQMAFAGLVLRAAYAGGSVQLRDSLKQTMLAETRPMIRDVIHAGVEQKIFFTRFPDEIGELLLLLFANLNDEIAMLLATDASESCIPAILSQLTVYRHAAETLIGAPYGTLTLCDLGAFPGILEALSRQNRRLAGQA